MTLVVILIALLLIAAILFLRRYGMNWGATRGERAMTLTGDAWLDEEHAIRLTQTRGITVRAPPEMVWRWIAQMGRGAGWYSYDRIDNGRRMSARHIVSWIPEPGLGDAAAIGYLRHLDPGREMAWWTGRGKFLGTAFRSVMTYLVDPHPQGARVVLRVDAEVSGVTARVFTLVFPFIDSVMAIRQLLNLKERVERFGTRTKDPVAPETGDRDQFQFYEVIYASGEGAGTKGKEAAQKARKAAVEDGVVSE